MTPIQKTITVPLTATAAFTLFLKDISVWWPTQSHSVTGPNGPQPNIEVEMRKGGKITEITANGKRIPWGEILGWEDGAYASFTWHPGRDADEATVVSVIFEGTQEGCRVKLTHGGFDILGPTADAVSQSYLSGWDMVLGSYHTAANNQRAYA